MLSKNPNKASQSPKSFPVSHITYSVSVLMTSKPALHVCDPYAYLFLYPLWPSASIQQTHAPSLRSRINAPSYHSWQALSAGLPHYFLSISITLMTMGSKLYLLACQSSTTRLSLFREIIVVLDSSLCSFQLLPHCARCPGRLTLYTTPWVPSPSGFRQECQKAGEE